MSEKSRCNIISFGHINLYILLIILGAGLNALKEYLSVQINSKGPGKQHPVITTINYAMGLCLSFILLIRYKIYNKENKKTNISYLDKTMHSQNKEITKKEKFLWILYGSAFDFFANLIYAYVWIKDEDYLCFWPSNMFLMSLFSYFILKMKLYRHHYLSIIIINIFGLVYTITYICWKPDFVENILKGNTIYLIAEGFFNILYVLYKFFMFKKFIKSFEILSLQGLIELILGIIVLIITTTCYPKFDNFKIFKENLEKSKEEKIIFCSLLLTNFFTSLTIFIILDIFTPFHILLLNILSDIISGFIEETYISPSKLVTVTYFILIIISLFMVLVFIEIIQLNFCGLSTMTKKNIEERAKLDSDLSNESNNIDDVSNIQRIGSKKISLVNEGDYNIELKEIDSRKMSQITSNY